MGNDKDDTRWKDAIVSTLKGGGDKKKGKLPVKDLRKAVLLSLQLDVSDKAAKKSFKKVVQSLEDEGTVSLNAEGIVKLVVVSKQKDKKKKKRQTEGVDESPNKKAKVEKAHDEQHGQEKEDEQDEDDGEDAVPQHQESTPAADKNKPCKGNPQGVTRLFLGNLPFSVDEASLGDFLPGTVTHIKWITDKETGKFYGSAFIEMDAAEHAAQAVAKAGQQLMGRPVKINFAPSLPGDVWPPAKKTVTGGGGGSGGGQAGGTGVKAMSEKPENCCKLFIGNLSYDIDDEGITNFFANVDAEVKAVRWIHHKDTGDFKGVGFVEFWSTEACEKGATLNGKNLLGRPIRIDWTD